MKPTNALLLCVATLAAFATANPVADSDAPIADIQDRDLAEVEVNQGVGILELNPNLVPKRFARWERLWKFIHQEKEDA